MKTHIESKLILKRLFRELLKDQLMELRWAKQFRCDVCNELCAEVTISRKLFQDGTESSSLVHKGFTQSLDSYLSDEDFDRVIQLFRANELNKIFEMDREFVPFYCPKCNKNYCSNHWNRWVEFDEGYYDAEYGYCPKRHRRMLFD